MTCWYSGSCLPTAALRDPRAQEGELWRRRLRPCAAPRRSELQQLANLNATVGRQPVRPFKGSVHAGEIHDVEGLDLPRACRERAALHRLADRVPGYRGLQETGTGRGRVSAPLSTNAPAALTCASNAAQARKSDSSPLSASASAPHQHQVAHALTVSRRPDIDPVGGIGPEPPPVPGQAVPSPSYRRADQRRSPNHTTIVCALFGQARRLPRRHTDGSCMHLPRTLTCSLL